MLRLGIDVGSTTLKCVLMDKSNKILYSSYTRHFSKIKETVCEILSEISTRFSREKEITVAVSGSAGMGFAQGLKIPFIQEVYATKVAVESFSPQADTVIELGGEDAKVIFLDGGLEVRMNGSCAGGTGAFIDQMATLLNITPDEMNTLAKDHKKIYSVASRCGVFAKSDIQPLLNQGAQREDVAASIFYAVVNQTIAGLAQGRELKGNILYLGGPLTFLSQLRDSFDNSLNTKGICPDNSLYYVAMGTALLSSQATDIRQLIREVSQYQSENGFESSQPLFNNKAEYESFTSRHNKTSVEQNTDRTYSKGGYIGIDAGSTTVKLVVLDEDERLLFSRYASNKGNPVTAVKDFLSEFFDEFPSIKILGSAVTGYGEEMLKSAFSCDFGIVETMAHFYAAKKFSPNVDFILDIGGQDIKCFKVVDGVIDDIFLNEACSSGCGSFLQSFAEVLGYTVQDFATMGLFAQKPVDLGSRCTVFMNSSVKQAQKDGATIEDISAGLSVSVVKNALYKVIRTTNAKELGKNIVVQGGTFLNDAVLRAFELELGAEVIRPKIAGIMGAFGAALYAKERVQGASSTLDKQQIKSLEHKVSSVTCGLCTNHCSLTVNTFDGKRKFIGGNRCDRPLSDTKGNSEVNLYDYKHKLLARYYNGTGGKRAKIGIPLGLNMYELLPFWHAFLKTLDFDVVVSPLSNRELYIDGQHTIPSDTVCFPAKLMHGHAKYLANANVDAIFYPCMSYNIDEGMGDNHYNCPVVAYYPEVIAANLSELKGIPFIYDYIGIHRPKDLGVKLWSILNNNFSGRFGKIPLQLVKKAVKNAFIEHNTFLDNIRKKGAIILEEAARRDLPVIVLCGRPYHLDPEVNHGIDKLICASGAALITEDAISHLIKPFSVDVLNQWTYHSRLYAAAEYVTHHKNYNLVQLVSFGCGVDAITTDEVRSILTRKGKIYTQIKIDEITNLGAVKIRLKSLFAAMER